MKETFSTKNCNLQFKKIIWLLLAFAIVLVLHCKISVITGSGDNVFVHFMSKFANSFTSHNLTDIFVWAAVYLAIRTVRASEEKLDIPCAILSIILSAFYVIAKNYMNADNISFFNKNRYQIFLSLFCIAGFSALFYFCLRLLFLHLEKRAEKFFSERANNFNFFKTHFFLCGFLAIFVCWLPWIVMNYPGSFCPDSQSQLRQFFGDSAFTAHHPPLSTYIMGVLVKTGNFIWSKNFGCFLYLLFQTFVGALTFSLGIKKLCDTGLRFGYCIIGILFFALTPFWGCFAQWYEKDLLYAEVATLFLICLTDVVVKKSCDKKDVIFLTLTAALSSLLRNNGIYAVVPATLALIFYVEKRSRKFVTLSLLATIFVYGGFTKIIYPKVLGIKNGSVKEVLSIPFQQTARYVKRHGNEVTEYEKQVIDSVLDYNSLAEKYNPKISDPIKGMYKGDNSKLPEYFKVWFKMFWKHPETYVSAALNGAYGYLAPAQQNIEPGILIDYGKRFSYLTSIGIHRKFSERPAQFFASVRQASINIPLVKYLCMPGLYTWIFVICCFILIRKKRYGAIVIFIPELMNILVCIASPLPNAIRYELPTVAAMPFLIGWFMFAMYGNESTSRPTIQ